MRVFSESIEEVDLTLLELNHEHEAAALDLQGQMGSSGDTSQGSNCQPDTPHVQHFFTTSQGFSGAHKCISLFIFESGTSKEACASSELI